MKSLIASILKSFEAHRLVSVGKYDEAKDLMLGK
jgi:hypothetical protein